MLCSLASTTAVSKRFSAAKSWQGSTLESRQVFSELSEDMKKRAGRVGLVGHRKLAVRVFKATQIYPKGLPIGPWLPVFAAPGLPKLTRYTKHFALRLAPMTRTKTSRLQLWYSRNCFTSSDLHGDKVVSIAIVIASDISSGSMNGIIYWLTFYSDMLSGMGRCWKCPRSWQRSLGSGARV